MVGMVQLNGTLTVFQSSGRDKCEDGDKRDEDESATGSGRFDDGPSPPFQIPFHICN